MADWSTIASFATRPAGGAGYFEGAIRDPGDPVRPGLIRTVSRHEPFTIDLLYGDQQGRQRSISRFTLFPVEADGWLCRASQHWVLDRPAPR